MRSLKFVSRFITAGVLLFILSSMEVQGVSWFDKTDPPYKEGCPFVVESLEFSEKCGVSYNPDQEIKIDLELKNTSDEAIDLKNASWKIRRTREMVSKEHPDLIWHSSWVDFEEIASGKLSSSSVKPGSNEDVSISFTPGKYGFFSLFIQNEPKGEWYRYTGAAVVRQPAKGFKPDSPAIPTILRHKAKENAGIWVDLAGRLGYKWVRYGKFVPKVNTKIKEYDWSEPDAIAEALRRNEIYLLGCTMPPNWYNPPTIEGRQIYYSKNKQNMIVKPEDFGTPGEFGTYADVVYQTAKRYKDIYSTAYIRNEPWEGGSIARYHATGKYFRDVAKITREAARTANPDFKLGGNDSIANFEDNIMTGENATDYFDLLFVHSYGKGFNNNHSSVQAEALGKQAWDTEHWMNMNDLTTVNNATTKVTAGFAKNSPIANGVYIPARGHHAGKGEIGGPRPVAQALSTWLHFIEDTEYKEELFPECLPWVFMFKNKENIAKKDLAIVFGRIKIYGHHNYKPEWGDWAWKQVNAEGSMTISDPDAKLHVYDIEGNDVTERNGEFVKIELVEDPRYIQSDAGYADLVAKLSKPRAEFTGKAIQASIFDFTTPLADGAELKIKLENRVLADRKIKLNIQAPEGWKLKNVETVTLAPGEVRELTVPIKQYVQQADNKYPFTVKLESAGTTQVIQDDLNVSVFRRGTINIDGDLSEWREAGAVPVTISGGMIEVDPTEAAWFPMYDLKGSDASDMFCRFAGMWDDDFFYVSAEIVDSSENFSPSPDNSIMSLTLPPPMDYIYWNKKMPLMPSAKKGDALKIAFEQNDIGDKNDPWLPAEFQKKLDPRFVGLTPDYEYDLYPAKANRLVEPVESVIERWKQEARKNGRKMRKCFLDDPQLEFVGDILPEVWRMSAPGVPRHNYYPYSKRFERDQGVVKEAKFSLVRKDNMWIYEAAIPWSELAEVKPEEGKVVNFSFYVLDKGKRALVWTKGRSSCNKKKQLLHPTWMLTEHIRTPWAFVGKKKNRVTAEID